MTQPIRVAHLVGSLDPGGAERTAVNLANRMPRDRFRMYVASSRTEGPLADLIEPHVGKVCFHRKRLVEPKVLSNFRSFLEGERIQIVHVHDIALVFAIMSGAFPLGCKLVWHCHNSAYAKRERISHVASASAAFASGIITVSEPLRQWITSRPWIRTKRVWQIPNFVRVDTSVAEAPELPGRRGARVACVANFRWEKDHLGILRAINLVRRAIPDVHLVLLGSPVEPKIVDMVRAEIDLHGLQANVSILGYHEDVAPFLKGCDVGVLGSLLEGMPLSVVEYGVMGLGVVATNVGQIPEILDEGRAGILIPPASADILAEKILWLLQHPDERRELGQRLQKHVHMRYSEESVIAQVASVYDTVLGP